MVSSPKNPEVAQPKPKKRKRKSSDGQVARGRPRDPSLLKREKARKQGDAQEDLQEQEQKPEQVAQEVGAVVEDLGSQAPVKRRKLSKADRHAQEIAAGYAGVDGERVESTDKPVEGPQEPRTTRAGRKRGAEAATRKTAEEEGRGGEQPKQPEVPAEPQQQPRRHKKAKQQTEQAAELGRTQLPPDGDRVASKPRTRNRRTQQTTTEPAAEQKDVAPNGQSARAKRKRREVPATDPVVEIPETQPEPEVSPAQEPQERAVESESETPESNPGQQDKQAAPASSAEDPRRASEHVTTHSDGRRISTIGRPGPQRRRKRMSQQAAVEADAGHNGNNAEAGTGAQRPRRIRTPPKSPREEVAEEQAGNEAAEGNAAEPQPTAVNAGDRASRVKKWLANQELSGTGEGDAVL